MAAQDVRPQQLSIEEIAQLWSAETGDSAKDLERELAEWAYAASADGASLGPESEDGDLAPTRLKVEPDPHRQLCWSDLENFCREQDRLLPHFWAEPADDEQTPLLEAGSKEKPDPDPSEVSRLVVRAMERIGSQAFASAGARRSPDQDDLATADATGSEAQVINEGEPSASKGKAAEPSAGTAPSGLKDAALESQNDPAPKDAKGSSPQGAKDPDPKPAPVAALGPPAVDTAAAARRPAEPSARGSLRKTFRPKARASKAGTVTQDVPVLVMKPGSPIGTPRRQAPAAASSLPGIAAGAICGALLAAAGAAAWLEFGGPGLNTIWQTQQSAPATDNSAAQTRPDSEALAAELAAARQEIAGLHAQTAEADGVRQSLSETEQANADLRTAVQQLTTALAVARTGGEPGTEAAAAEAATRGLSEALATAQGEIEAGKLARLKLEQNSAALTENLTAARAEIETLSRAGAADRADVARLEKELGAATARTEDLTAGQQTLEANLAAAEAELATARTRLSESSAAEIAARDEIENLRQSGAAAQAVIQRLTTELGAADQETRTATAGREALTGRMAAAESDLEAAQARVAELTGVETESRRLKATLGKTERDVEGLKTAAERAGKEIARLNAELETGRQATVQLRASLETTQLRSRGLEGDLSLAMKANTELHAEMEGLNGQAAELSTLLAGAREQSGQVTAARDSATARADELARNLSSAEKEIESLRASLDGTSGTSAQLASKLATAERQVAGLGEERQAAVARAESLNQALSQSRDETETLRAAANAAKSDTDRLKAELAAVQDMAAQQETQRATAQARVELLASSLADARSELRTLESESAQDGENLGRLDAELDRWKTEAKDLARSLAEAELRAAGSEPSTRAATAKEALIAAAPAAPDKTDKLKPSDVVPAAAPAVAAAPKSAPKPAAKPAGRTQTANRSNPAQLMLTRGGEYLERGDVASARLFFEQAADMGDPTALTAVGRTYDPRVLSELGTRGTLGNPALAIHWYERAIAAGEDQASRDLQALRAWLKP